MQPSRGRDSGLSDSLHQEKARRGRSGRAVSIIAMSADPTPPRAGASLMGQEPGRAEIRDAKLLLLTFPCLIHFFLITPFVVLLFTALAASETDSSRTPALTFAVAPQSRSTAPAYPAIEQEPPRRAPAAHHPDRRCDSSFRHANAGAAHCNSQLRPCAACLLDVVLGDGSLTNTGTQLRAGEMKPCEARKLIYQPQPLSLDVEEAGLRSILLND